MKSAIYKLATCVALLAVLTCIQPPSAFGGAPVVEDSCITIYVVSVGYGDTVNEATDQATARFNDIVLNYQIAALPYGLTVTGVISGTQTNLYAFPPPGVWKCELYGQVIICGDPMMIAMFMASYSPED